jgi:methylated-DNA-protein-cysteine methyltransferase-like protein
MIIPDFPVHKCVRGHGLNSKERIWQIVYQIPLGKVASYGQVAKMADLPGYARYVGYVMKNLPGDTRLPWYRVVNAQGRISFQPGTSQYLRQKSLLEAEGVVFIEGRFSMRQYQWQLD